MPELLPGIIIALPFLAAAIIRIPGINVSRILVDCFSVATAAGTTVLAAILYTHSMEVPVVHWIGGWVPREEEVTGIALVADGISSGFILLTSALTTAAFLFTFRRYKTMGSLLHILTLIFLGSFSGFVLAGDLLTMFVFLELMGLSSYVLTAFKFQDDAPVQAAFNIAIVATTGAFIFLMGVTMIYGIAGTPNIAEAVERLAQIPASPALAVAIALLLTGLAIKSALFPFHFAHADSHTVAPAPQAGLFSAVLMQAGLYGIARLGGLLLDLDALNPDTFRILLIAGGILTAFIAAMMSVVQNNLKRILSFTGISHIGIAAVGVGIFNTEGLAGTGLYMAGHAAVKMSLFLIAGVLLHRFSSVYRGKLAGSCRKNPVLPVMLIVGALALAGVPPSGLYGGKVMIGAGLAGSGFSWIIILLYLAAAITGAALIRFAIGLIWTEGIDKDADPMFIREGSRETEQDGGYAYMTAIPAVLLSIGIIIPLIPQVTGGFEKITEYSFDRDRYVESILTGEAEPAIDTTPLHIWKAGDLAKGILSGLFAIIAGTVMAISRFNFSRITAGPLGFIRNMHSGHVGDYLIWMMLGTACAAAWLLWQL